MAAIRKATAALLLAWMLCWASLAVADVAVPALTGHVVDQTATLTAEQAASLEQTLQAFEARKGSQIAVLIVPTTAPESIEQYGIRVAQQWKLGRAKVDDGALLLVAKDDRKLRIEVGYGLEGSLTDVTSKRIIDEFITPKFKDGDYAGGIAAGVDRMIRVVDGEPLPEPKPPSPGIFDSIESIGPIAFFAVLIFGGIFRAMFGRLLGAGVTGGLVGVVAWFALGTLGVALIVGVIGFFFTLVGDSIMSFGGGRGGSWSGGGGGGFSGRSSGGYSGGGGTFGGGGASGSW